MKNQTDQTIYHMIRSYLHDVGTSRTTQEVLNSYIDAVERLRCTAKGFQPMLERLNTVLKNTEPKVIPLVHLIEAFEKEMAAFDGLSLEEAKKQAIAILRQKLTGLQADMAKVIAHCMSCISTGDLIIAHSSTNDILEGLVRAHTELKRIFKVLVLKQDVAQTKELVNALNRHGVDHFLIPEYNLSHYLKSPAKLFLGAVSVSSDQQAVTGIGTANVVSLCHWYRVPVYLFVESIKFAHQTLSDQHIHYEELDETAALFTFHMRTFSHDFIDLGMIDHIITERGEIPGPAK